MTEETDKRKEEEKRAALMFMLTETIKNKKQLEFATPNIENAKLNGKNFTRNQAALTLERLEEDGLLKSRGTKKIYSILELYKILEEKIENVEEFVEKILKKKKRG